MQEPKIEINRCKAVDEFQVDEKLSINIDYLEIPSERTWGVKLINIACTYVYHQNMIIPQRMILRILFTPLSWGVYLFFFHILDIIIT